MANKRCFYLTEGECEEKLISALKTKPQEILPGKIKKFNPVQEKLKPSQLMTYAPGSLVILVFDTDVETTDILKENLRLLRKVCRDVQVLTVLEVLNFEDEIERAILIRFIILAEKEVDTGVVVFRPVGAGGDIGPGNLKSNTCPEGDGVFDSSLGAVIDFVSEKRVH